MIQKLKESCKKCLGKRCWHEANKSCKGWTWIYERQQQDSKARQGFGVVKQVLSVQEKNPNPNVTCKTRDGLSLIKEAYLNQLEVWRMPTQIKERETLEESHGLVKEDQIRVDHCERSLSTRLDEPDPPDLSPLCLFLFVLPCICLLFLSWQLVIWFVFK